MKYKTPDGRVEFDMTYATVRTWVISDAIERVLAEYLGEGAHPQLQATARSFAQIFPLTRTIVAYPLSDADEEAIAFGAWWVSVYAPAVLEASRAEPKAVPRPGDAKLRRPGKRVYSPR